MTKSLDKSIAAKFSRYTDDALIRRIEQAADFGYDDEVYELNRRLGARALDWRWTSDNKIEVFDRKEVVDE